MHSEAQWRTRTAAYRAPVKLPHAAAPSSIFTLQGAQSAICNPPKAGQCCTPPRSAIRHASHATSVR
eukprot:5520234-Alexandrium_andersonii.AAC.1